MTEEPVDNYADPVSNKNDMIVDTVADILCEDNNTVEGYEMSPEEQLDCRIRLKKLQDATELYAEILANEEKRQQRCVQ